MKTLAGILGACMFLSCISTSFAQDVKLGAAANFGTTNWAKDFSDAKTRVVFGIGGAGQYAITDKLNVGAELLLASIGPKIDDQDDDYFGRIAIKTIQLPLFASYEVMEALQVHAGFQPAALLSVNAILDEPNAGKYDLSDDFASFNMDFILGASYDITENVTAMIRVNQGLVDLDTELESRELKTAGIQLGVRYWLIKQ